MCVHDQNPTTSKNKIANEGVRQGVKQREPELLRSSNWAVSHSLKHPTALDTAATNGIRKAGVPNVYAAIHHNFRQIFILFLPRIL